jgi:hypothetical protein
MAVVEFAPVVLAQRLRIDVDKPGYVGFWNTVASERFDLTTTGLVGPMGATTHLRSRPLLVCRPAGILVSARRNWRSRGSRLAWGQSRSAVALAVE